MQTRRDSFGMALVDKRRNNADGDYFTRSIGVALNCLQEMQMKSKRGTEVPLFVNHPAFQLDFIHYYKSALQINAEACVVEPTVKAEG